MIRVLVSWIGLGEGGEDRCGEGSDSACARVMQWTSPTSQQSECASSRAWSAHSRAVEQSSCSSEWRELIARVSCWENEREDPCEDGGGRGDEFWERRTSGGSGDAQCQCKCWCKVYGLGRSIARVEIGVRVRVGVRVMLRDRV